MPWTLETMCAFVTDLWCVISSTCVHLQKKVLRNVLGWSLGEETWWSSDCNVDLAHWLEWNHNWPCLQYVLSCDALQKRKDPSFGIISWEAKYYTKRLGCHLWRLPLWSPTRVKFSFLFYYSELPRFDALHDHLIDLVSHASAYWLTGLGFRHTW